MTVSVNTLNAPDIRRLEANHQQLLSLSLQLEQAMELEPIRNTSICNAFPIPYSCC